MRFLLFISLLISSFLAISAVAAPAINAHLPEVGPEANRIIQETKQFNPLADCFNSSMFTSQSPRTSAQQISSCVGRKINNLPDVPSDLKAKVKDIPNMGWAEILKLKNCFNSLEAMKKCSPAYNLLNHEE
jgi:hypothetical protein